MPLSNLLLRRLRIHDAPPLLRRNQSLCKHPPLHFPHKTTPASLFSLRPTPKESRSNVRSPNNLYRPYPHPSRRFNPLCPPREIRRTALQTTQRRRKGRTRRENPRRVVPICMSQVHQPHPSRLGTTRIDVGSHSASSCGIQTTCQIRGCGRDFAKLFEIV